jgi:hypothetical protein
VLGVLLPVGVVAQAPAGTAYSGVADGYVSQALLAPSPTQPAPLEVTLGETTGAVNSAANIIPDSPGSPENEAEDFSVGTATPLRLATGGEIIAQPFSVQSSAPADAGGSNALVDINEPPVTLRVTRAETNSQAALDASTAATQNNVVIANAVLGDGVSLPAGTSNSDVARTADGAIRGFADCAVDAPTTLLSDPATGEALISAQAITASSESTANGTTSNNTTDFRVLGLAIAGAEGVTIDAVPSATNPDFVTVTLNIAGQPAITADLPRGVNLLDPSTFPAPPTGGADVPVGELLAGLEPILTPLIGEGGPLQGTELILGAGNSVDGDGTFASGFIDVITLRVGLAGSPITSLVVCHASSAVNAVQANAVDFTPVQRATPAETIFTNPVPQPPAPEPDPEPEPEEEEEEEPEEEEEEEPEEAEPDPPAEAADEELPFTGLGLAAVAGMGGVMLLGGSLVRRMSGRRGVDSLGDETEQETQ